MQAIEENVSDLLTEIIRVPLDIRQDRIEIQVRSLQ